MSRSTFALLALCGSLALPALAGSPVVYSKGGKDVKDMKGGPAPEPIPTDLIYTNFEFVNSASVRGANGGRGDQNVFYEDVRYSHRTQITGPYYFRMGVEYQRWDFGTIQNTPLPNHLQAVSVPLALEYVVPGGAVAANLEIDPGFYFQNDLDSNAIDIPWQAYVTIPLSDKKLYAVVGAGGSGFYSTKVLPIGGLIWIVNDFLTVNAIAPKPSLVYTPNKEWEYRLEGEVNGGGFRVQNSPDNRYNNTVVSYYDVHGGAMITYTGLKPFRIGAGGGWSLEREFYFDRADKRFKVNGAPYAKLQVTADF